MNKVVAVSGFELLVAAVFSAVAINGDIRRRQIPNSICAALLVTGALTAGYCRGWLGFRDALLGAAIGFLIFLIPYWLGGMGGGDVKLMAGFGAVTGLHGVLPALLLVAASGGTMAVFYLTHQKLRRRTVPAAIPYAPAIVIGSYLVALSQIGGK